MTNYRPSWPERIFIKLLLESEWATCQRLMTAALITDNAWQVYASGVNGTPRGRPHCVDLPKLDGRCLRCVHAEKNAINQAARTGVKLEGEEIWTLYRPCLGCTNDIVQVGLSAVHFWFPYESDDWQEVFEILAMSDIHIQEEHVSHNGMEFSNMLVEWRKTWDFGLPKV